MEELIGLLAGAVIPLIIWLLDGKDIKKKNDLEIKKLNLENENLKLAKHQIEVEKKEVEEKLQYLDRMLDLEFINDLSDAVDNIFEHTKADRFLILLAKNGKTDFNIVNVVFEQHKNKKFRINAIARYRNVKIDLVYKEMLKKAEHVGDIELNVSNMEDSLLKHFYEFEGVNHSIVKHLARKPIDEDNDFLIFSSLATHGEEGYSKVEKAHIKTQYEGVIIPSLDKIMI